MKHILIISGDLVDSNMGGVGVRYWEIAHALAKHCSVTLAAPHKIDLQSDAVNLVAFDLEHGDIRELALQADVIVTHGFVLHFHPYLKDLGIPMAVDLYVPHLLESLVWHADDKLDDWIPAYQEYLRIQLELLRAGDFFFCASETQRDYWLGWLHAQKRINPHTYAQDPTLRKLIDVVPFGLPEEPPRKLKPVLKGVHPHISPDDRLILWSGGLFDWLDPLTLIRAISLLVPRHPEIKLYFMGTTHPNPVMSNVSMPQKAIQLSKELGVYDTHIFFGEWVPYTDRQNYLLEADLAVLSHPDHIETRFAFRTRLLDCIWAGLPIVATEGGILSDWVRQYNLGLVVPMGDVQAMAAAIEDLLERIELDIFTPRFDTLRETLQWDHVIQPLRAFCQNPVQAADQGKYLTELERISKDKDKYIQTIIIDKDAYIETIIKDKDSHIERIIQDKDAYTDQVIQDHQEMLKQLAFDKDIEIAALQLELDTIKSIQLSTNKSQEITQHEAFETERPFVSVIVLNYNGAHFLTACMEALQAQTYPRDSFEVIVSDNGSTDDSIKLLNEQYPWVRVLANGRNLGFTLGNNVAIRQSRGDYVILLNNDTAPQPCWLEELARVAQSDPKIGLVTAHLQLFYDQMILRLEADTFTPPQDGRELGVMVFDVDSGAWRGVVQYLDGFYWRESLSDDRSFRWAKGRALLGVPVPNTEGDWELKLGLSSGRPDGSAVKVRIYLQHIQLGEWLIPSGTVETISIDMPASTFKLSQPVVQNTGSILFRNGASRDRGTYVRNNEVFYETDGGQYDQQEEVFAGCGASLMMSRKMLDDVGLLDEDIFIYYDDTDISWRAWLKGWKTIYAPKALIRHIHTGTNKQWSPQFIYLTDRNRLAILFKNGTFGQATQAWIGYILLSIRTGWQAFWFMLRRVPGWRIHAGRFRINLKVLWTLFLWQPMLWVKRWQVQSAARISPSQLMHWFEED